MATIRPIARLFLVAVFIATAFGKPAANDDSTWSEVDHSAQLAHKRARSAHAQSRTAPTDQERTPDYWTNMARASIDEALRLQTLNTNVAKNVVLFLGDGMGVSTVTTARILKGQKAGNPGEETVLAMDSLPYTAMSKTYNIDQQVPDSAGTATAFLCGVKAEAGVIGVDGRTRYGNCSSSKGHEAESIIVHAERAGKSTGIVTTARVTHATPASAYAHSAARGWEADSDLSAEARENNCTDIAYQLVEEAPDVEVILGGGRRMFTPRTATDPESGNNGDRNDGVDLIQRWQDGKTGRASYVWNGTDFRNVDPESTDYLLGLFEMSHMKYSADRDLTDPAEEPTIADMTRKAIEILQKNDNGFFLLVEGGRIDHGHHASQAVKALEDTLAFDDAVQVAKDMLDPSDSLIVVTADHSHTLTFAGYPDRGHPIFGQNVYTPDDVWDGLPYTTLLYGNGAGYSLVETTNGNVTQVTRQNVTDVNTADKEYKQQSAVPLASETHGGEDVIIMAGGPMAHLFHGVQEQHYIAHVMMYAACLGEYTEHCDKPSTPKPVGSAGPAARGSYYTVALTTILYSLLLMAATPF
ncbi:ALPL [Branchiostoma lanceolatum]|uniref:Alkaline phosphatase n=1 Tax=Branchiostoma lanceolatum TaxID=7740 RepID=A0A8K0EV43_BRALA|nr:ALPL [Branchiostoma lanceolatum]